MSNNATIGVEKQTRTWIPGAQRAGVAAVVGGGLLAVDLIWQGILNLRLGGDAMLHDPATLAYWINNVGLLISAALLVVGFVGLWAHVDTQLDGRLWTAGVWLTGLALGAMVVGSAAQVGLALFGQIDLSESVGIIYGIGGLVAWLGVLPLGVALLRAGVMRRAGILFAAAFPLFVVSMFLPGGSTASGAIIGGVPIGAILMAILGFAWVVAGYTLWRDSTEMSPEADITTA